MKNIFKTAALFLTLLGYEVITGCDRDIIPGTVLERSIVPNVISEAMTKAPDPEALDALKSSGFKMDIVSDNDYYDGIAGKYGETRTVSWDNTNNIWEVSPEAYWLHEVNMRFWAYNLSNADGLNITTPVASSSSLQFSYNTDKADNDLMMAYSEKTHPSTTHTSGGAEDQIDLHFYRALSKICFETGDFHVSLSDYYVSSITIGRLASSGSATFDGTSFNWNPGSTSAYYTTSGATAINNSFYVIPQGIAEGEVALQVTLSSSDPSKPDVELSKSLGAVTLTAGNYYKYKISVNKDITNEIQLSLTLTVAPWELYDRDLEIKESNVTSYLTYTSGNIDAGESRIYIHNGMPVNGSFSLGAPKGAKLLLALDGNLDAFSVSPKITYVTGGTINFQITPVVNDPKIDYQTRLHIYLVGSDGSVSELDQDVMKEGGVYKHYTIILPAQ